VMLWELHSQWRRVMRPSVGLLLVGVMLIAGCGRAGQAKHDTRPWPNATDSPGGVAFFDPPEAERVGSDEFVVVTTKEREAIARLEQSEWVELTAQEAGELLDRPFGAGQGRIVLLRGWAVNERLDQFSIFWREERVL